MKYNKAWKSFMASDDIDPRRALSYDKWKQRIKLPSTHFRLNWHLYLLRECEAVDRSVFCDRSLFCWSRGERPKDEELVKLCDLNKRTLYKICKKLDKKMLGCRSAKLWYGSSLREKRFRFLGCTDLVKARMRCTKQEEVLECPICFDALDDPERCVITRCCHTFCEVCATKMWGRVQAARERGATCPVCRHII